MNLAFTSPNAILPTREVLSDDLLILVNQKRVHETELPQRAPQFHNLLSNAFSNEFSNDFYLALINSSSYPTEVDTISVGFFYSIIRKKRPNWALF